ncbi:L-threonine aldolase [Hyunsoonleella jejuensis]|uniref:L-threonine aldolase n=1 Tax=Hyunsoonleella jejuensis TaxID=419940 RepID=A0A1H8ZQX3_9FLAO|nr:aminotransferase class I/II-fold pyridoxal phosphate-dependent enzyme [Hyunsoonleella jejuensis]SEP66775.1 L-threonine aldolase [Hyunsoonleella jejuensis]
MKKVIDKEEGNNRRDFLKKCSLSTVPFLLPTVGLNAMSWSENKTLDSVNNPEVAVNFIYDGLNLSPRQYLKKLTEIDERESLEPDFYGNGGTTRALEEKFAKLTGKGKAIYLPTGTMANQLAIKLLNGNNTKVIVPENSHIFRDEADASQSVHSLRLVPIGKDKSYFQLDDLVSTVKYIDENEVFRSGLGTVVVENPIRRANGTAIPIATLKEIRAYCKNNGYKMHLDGARIHLASAFTNVSVEEYASYFDTVYVSLYKYLNANGGAMLCGDAEIIDQISHQRKILGGNMFQNWNNTAIALHYLDGITERLHQVVVTAKILIIELNKIDGITISPTKNGTNIYTLNLADNINSKELAEKLFEEHNILIRPSENGMLRFAVNESLLTRDVQEIINAWKTAVNHLRK